MRRTAEFLKGIVGPLVTLCDGLVPPDALADVMSGIDQLPAVSYQTLRGGAVCLCVQVMRILLLAQTTRTDLTDRFELGEIRKRRARLYFDLLARVRASTIQEMDSDAEHCILAGKWGVYVKHRFVWRTRAWSYLIALYLKGIQFRLGRAVDIVSVAADLTELLSALGHPE